MSSTPSWPSLTLTRYKGTTRLELGLSRDFGSEDLLLVQSELTGELAKVDLNLNLNLNHDLGSEDLLLVQSELTGELAKVNRNALGLRLPAAHPNPNHNDDPHPHPHKVLDADAQRFVVVQNYAAGQYYILDVLPSGASADGAPSAAASTAQGKSAGGLVELALALYTLRSSLTLILTRNPTLHEP